MNITVDGKFTLNSCKAKAAEAPVNGVQSLCVGEKEYFPELKVIYS